MPFPWGELLALGDSRLSRFGRFVGPSKATADASPPVLVLTRPHMSMKHSSKKRETKTAEYDMARWAVKWTVNLSVESSSPKLKPASPPARPTPKKCRRQKGDGAGPQPSMIPAWVKPLLWWFVVTAGVAVVKVVVEVLVKAQLGSW